MGITDDFVTLATCDVADLANWAAGGQAGSPTNNSTTKKEGDASINMGKTGIIAPDFGYDKTITATNLDRLLLVLWVYCDNQATLNLLPVKRVCLLDALENWACWNMSLKLGWNIWSFRVKNPDGTSATPPDYSAITKLRISFGTPLAADTIAVGSVKMDYWHYGTMFIVEGYSEATPCNFTDLYNYDVANTLGVVRKFNEDTFILDVIIQIGPDSATDAYFADVDKNIVFTDKAKGYWNNYERPYMFLMENKGRLRFGEVIDENAKTTKRGCNFLILDSNGYGRFSTWTATYVYLYSTTIRNPRETGIYGAKYAAVDGHNCPVRIWNCIFEHAYPSGQSNVDIYNLTVLRGLYGSSQIQGTIERFYIYNTYYSMAFRFDTDMTIKDVVIRNHGGIRWLGGTMNAYCVNCDFDEWKFLWHYSPWGYIYRQYEFDLTLRDKKTKAAISEATVTFWDKDGNQIFQVTTDANGKISTQTVSYCRYYQTAGNNPETLYSPFHLRIEKAGYQTYDDYGIVLDKKTELEIGLNKAVGIFLDFGRPVINLKKSDPENKMMMVL